MAIILENALLADFDPVRIETGSLRIDDGLIVERGKTVSREVNDEIVDCGGGVVLPGLVNGHTHLYLSLAVGMPPPAKPPENLKEILQNVWWRLDEALDADSIETSARVGALEALRCGTTTLFDHHASSSCVEDSLDLVEKGLADVGLRGVLCYETTDRHGPEGRSAGLEENRRYLEKRMQTYSSQFAGLVGAHASFTLEDETLMQLAALADDFDTGVHMHVAEDPCDEEDCQEKYQMFLIDRLAGYKLLRPTSIFVHGTHLDPAALLRINEAGAILAHTPLSNLNNGVGYAPLPAYRCKAMLGTDGFGSDLFAELKVAWCASRHEQARLTPNHVLRLLATSARRASEALQITLGKLERNAAADVVITDYRPSTPLMSENLAAHFVFGMSSRHVKDVLIDGRWVLRGRQVQTCSEHHVCANAGEVAARFWQRIAKSG